MERFGYATDAVVVEARRLLEEFNLKILIIDLGGRVVVTGSVLSDPEHKIITRGTEQDEGSVLRMMDEIKNELVVRH